VIEVSTSVAPLCRNTSKGEKCSTRSIETAAPESASHAVRRGPAKSSQSQCISLTSNRPDGNLPVKGEPTVSHWNYRVVQSFDRTEYFIVEVYYDGDAIQGWVDSGREGLRWDDYDDLKGSVEMIQKAFDKPLLRVVEGDRLVEVCST
jgi:hypothetical protein